MRKLSLNAAPVDNKDEGKLAELGYKQVSRVHATCHSDSTLTHFAGIETGLVCSTQLRRIILHHFGRHWYHDTLPVWPHDWRSGGHVHWMDLCELLHTVRWAGHGRDHQCYPNCWRTLLLGRDTGAESEAGGVLLMDDGVVQLCRTMQVKEIVSGTGA